MSFDTICNFVMFSIYDTKTEGGIVQQNGTCYLNGILVVELVEKPKEDGDCNKKEVEQDLFSCSPKSCGKRLECAE